MHTNIYVYSLLLACRFPHRVPVPGMETHIPVLFLDLNGKGAPLLLSRPLPPATSLPLSPFSPHPAEDFHQSCQSAALAGGLDAPLGDEDDDEFFNLHIVKHFDSEVKGSIVRVVPPLCCRLPLEFECVIFGDFERKWQHQVVKFSIAMLF